MGNPCDNMDFHYMCKVEYLTMHLELPMIRDQELVVLFSPLFSFFSFFSE